MFGNQDSEASKKGKADRSFKKKKFGKPKSDEDENPNAKKFGGKKGDEDESLDEGDEEEDGQSPFGGKKDQPAGQPAGPSIGKDFHLRTTVHPKAGSGADGQPDSLAARLHQSSQAGPPHPAVHKFHSTARDVMHANYKADMSAVANLVMERWLQSDAVNKWLTPGGSNGRF